ncbi:MAG: hypothetical protein KA124_06975, partial [Luteimonas sp.]|nr:hypothetical protein [Luteimonas sp.]
MTGNGPRWTRRNVLGAGVAGLAGAMAAPIASTATREAATAPTAIAARPRPTAAQLAWQREE